MIDLRSDTVTRPDAGMRAAMANAVVGDDVFGEDPTVLELESAVAELLGKEAGVFVPSGTMGNQIALRIHTRPGDEVILEADAHIRHYESGAAAGLSGVQICPLTGENGILTAADVASAVRPGNEWDPPSRMVALENTHNRAGGTIHPLGTIQAIGQVARDHGMAFHLDGARLWNASAETGIKESDYAAPFDSISVCLSKGLGSPVGSVLVGSTPYIKEARRIRKMFGGGMRQVGVLAAAGLYALNQNRPRLSEDHKKARLLAEGLASCRAVRLDASAVETNIVMFDVIDGRSAVEVLGSLAAKDVHMVPFGPTRIRATTHLDVEMDAIERALELSKPVLD